MPNDDRRPTIQYDEQQFQLLEERLERCIDADEQRRIKAELVRCILTGEPGRQQHAMRNWAWRRTHHEM